MRPTGLHRYGIIQPVGGTPKATMVACHGPLGVVPSGGARNRLTAATLAVPVKATQPCICAPGITGIPAQTDIDWRPGQITPHWKGPGSTYIRTMGSPSGATTARTAGMADTHGSPRGIAGPAVIS